MIHRGAAHAPRGTGMRHARVSFITRRGWLGRILLGREATSWPPPHTY